MIKLRETAAAVATSRDQPRGGGVRRHWEAALPPTARRSWRGLSTFPVLDGEI